MNFVQLNNVGASQTWHFMHKYHEQGFCQVVVGRSKTFSVLSAVDSIQGSLTW